MEKTELRPKESPPRWTALLWQAFLSALLLGWALPALAAPWGSLSPGLLRPAAAAAAAWLLCAGAGAVKKPWLAWLMRLAPWALLAPWAAQLFQGLLLWLNCVLSLWNQIHQDALVLFQASATARSVLAISLAVGTALGQAVWAVVSRRDRLFCALSGLALLVLRLLLGGLSPLGCALWLSALLGLWFSGADGMPPRQSLRLWAAGAAALCLCALLLPTGELAAVTRLRRGAAQEVQDLRYGADPFPRGQLARAGALHQGEEEHLLVRTGQEKNLYLRAYVGAEYADGVWSPLPNAAYGGVYAGMLDWLAEQGFDPLTQPAAYYALSQGEGVPEANPLVIQVTGGTRGYLYLPAGTASSSAAGREKKDLRVAPLGLRGAVSYTAEELSPARPAELTVRADWVADPQTEAQRQYAQAEALYRAFVYDVYTRADPQLSPLLEELFWQNYAPENDSLYSAVDQVRKVLRGRVTYVRDPQDSTEGDPIADLLMGSRRGNAALYASAAVEALRLHGIPARYVEGYYLSAAAAAKSGDGTVSLTGQDTHAWVEVYFDGIGWLPVDVTPGYYYDAVTLRQMVSLPDTVKKTAALENNGNGGEDVSPVPQPSDRPQPGEVVRNAALALLGLAALLALVLTAWFLLLRLTQAVRLCRMVRRYRRAAPGERARLLKRWIYASLSAREIDACLGWNTAGTDQEVALRVPGARPGEYARAADLMEKFTFGGLEPEPFELRALQVFLEKVFPARRPLPLPRRGGFSLS